MSIADVSNIKQTLEQLRLTGFAPHPTLKGVLVTQKFIDSIVAAAVEGTADAVHMVLEEENAGSSGEIGNESEEQGNREELRSSTDKGKLGLRAGGQGSGCDEEVAESHGTSCGPKGKEEEKSIEPKKSKNEIQKEKFESFQQGNYTKDILGIWPPSSGRGKLYKAMMTGDWVHHQAIVGLIKDEKKVEYSVKSVGKVGIKLGQWMMATKTDESTGEKMYRLIMNKATDAAKGQGITEDQQHAALVAVQKLLGGQGLSSSVSKPILDDFAKSLGLGDMKYITSSMGSWTGNPNGQAAQYLKRVAADYYGRNWEDEYRGGSQNYAYDKSTFKYEELKAQALAVKALSTEYMKLSGMQYMYRGMKTGSALSDGIHAAINAGKAVEIPVNSLTGFSASKHVAQSFAGSSGVVMRIKINPEDVWVASGALGHLFGSFTHSEKEYVIGFKTPKLTLTPDDVSTNHHKPEWAQSENKKGHIYSKAEEGIEDTGTYNEDEENRVRKQMELWVNYAESGPSFDEEGKYQCKTCTEKLEPSACHIVSGTISMDAGSCRTYEKGKQRYKGPAVHRLTQIEAQYGERPKTKAFGCARCEYGAKAKAPDAQGRPSWCTFFGVHIQPLACCSMNEGDDSINAPGEKKIEATGVSLWHDIVIAGFTGPEEEGLRAMLSRIPPELLSNVSQINSASELNATHGVFNPKDKSISYNPKNFLLRQRFGKGEGWIYHSELTVVHEVGHSIYQNLSPEKKQEWWDLSGWIKGKRDGNSAPYVEKRPGWDAYTSKWTHKMGIEFPRYYSEKNPNEDFADCFAFFILGKGQQMERSKRTFLEQYIRDNVKTYPQALIQSPEQNRKLESV